MIHVYHVEVESGCDYKRTFLYADCDTGLPIDLTGYTAQMQVRKTYNGAANPYTTLEYSSEPDPVTNAPGAISFPGPGLVEITIPGADTIDTDWGTGVYDLILTSPQGVKTKLVKGLFTILQSSTR